MLIMLPPPAVHFVNRGEEKARIRREFEGRGPAERPLVIGLSGPVGMGATELANQVARGFVGRLTEALWVDLDEHRLGGEVDVADALGDVLGSLGVEPEFLKASFKARCRQYWQLTAEREFVLVVDNARYAAEVTPLIPASGGSVVIVTSRGPLHDLEDGAAVALPLPPLGEAASVELLEHAVGGRRLATDPETVQAVVALCGGLPAALRVAGAWIRGHRLRPLPRLLEELRDRLEASGVPVVEQVWDVGCDELPQTAGLLYRLLGVHPGPVFSRASATALLGLGPDACDEALEALDRAGLVDVGGALEDREARLRMPELLRGHAGRRARQDLGDDAIASAQARVVQWITRQAQRADLFAAGKRLVVGERVGEIAGAPDVGLLDPEQAADGDARERTVSAARWLYGERHTLLACVRLAHHRELDALTVALCEPLWTLALDHPHQLDVTEAFLLGVDSALRAGDTRAVVRMKCQAARWLWQSGEIDAAASELDAALAGAALLGQEQADAKLAASALEFRGMLSSVRGDWAAAAADFTRSRDVHISIGNDYGVMLQTYRLGQARAELGDREAALSLLTEAHDAAAALGRERLAARTGLALGTVLCAAGRTREARPLFDAALDAARRRGSGFEQARVLDALTRLCRSEGGAEQAERYAAAAAAIRVRNGAR